MGKEEKQRAKRKSGGRRQIAWQPMAASLRNYAKLRPSPLNIAHRSRARPVPRLRGSY